MAHKPTYEELIKRIRELERGEAQYKHVQKQLLEGQKKYQRMLENLRDVYFETTLDGTILEISPSVEKYARYKREDLIGKSLQVLFLDSKEWERLSELVCDKGSVDDVEFRLKGNRVGQPVYIYNSD